MESLLTTYDVNNNLKVFHTKYNGTQDSLLESQIANTYVVVSRQEIRAVAAFLKLNSLLRVSNAIDITVVDNINKELRFNVTYQFQSITSNNR
jgi:NADH:ubiquinone oxidoreductase subunit C